VYYLLDMIRKDEIGVDTKPYVQTVTIPSDTNDMEKILQNLDAEIEAATEDGYTGLWPWTIPRWRWRPRATRPRPAASPPAAAIPICLM